MLSKTIDVDGLKLFCREGGARGRGTSIQIDYFAAL